MLTPRAITNKLTSNPVTAQKIGPTPGKALRNAAIITLALLLLGHALFGYVMLGNSSYTLDILLDFAPYIVILITAAAPPVAALIAALLTVRDTHKGWLELLPITPLPDKTLIQGYTWAALYQMRLPLALVLGVAAMRAAIPATIAIEMFSSSTLTTITLWLLALAIILVNTAGLFYNAAGLGVLVALKYRQQATAAALAPLLMFLYQSLWFIITLAGLFLIGLFATSAMSRQPGLWNSTIAIIAALLMLAVVWTIHHETAIVLIDRASNHLRR